MNIPGIEILNKTEIMDTTLNPACLVIIFLACIIALLLILVGLISLDEDIVLYSPPFILVALVFFLLGAIFSKEEPTGRYEYEVSICDDANVVQLYKDYEYVESRGDIYIFRDPEVENDEDSCCNCDKHSYENECSHHDRVSPENIKNHNHTHKQKHGYIEENVESESPKAEVPNEPEAPAEDIDNVCDNCKSILEKNDKFCFQCGHKRKEE